MTDQRPVCGTMSCDICGIASPHAHHPYEVERERFMRAPFEEYFEAALVGTGGKSGLDPSGTYGWALFWKTRHLDGYQLPQVELCWKLWQAAWIARGNHHFDVEAACRSACGYPDRAPPGDAGEQMRSAESAHNRQPIDGGEESRFGRESSPPVASPGDAGERGRDLALKLVMDRDSPHHEANIALTLQSYGTQARRETLEEAAVRAETTLYGEKFDESDAFGRARLSAASDIRALATPQESR